ncbi:hypothetical protein WMY93_009883 [Mugilogobius chulae]|uniref:Growth arrest-specific 7 n=1 Tax=Mugilogobius chulae TaxID=88201 RepID=A0AAW0P9J2_9GOBI
MSGAFCKSLYPFSAEQHQQGLSFDAGDVIRVVQALPGGWWEGEKDGTRGWFPSSYVQIVESAARREELRESLPQHWRCYMSPQGRKYYGSGPASPTRRQHKDKDSTVTVNCVTFPVAAVTSEQQLLKPDEWSYCDYFWMQKEMADFIRERIKIEKSTPRVCPRLSQSPLATTGHGVQQETEQEGRPIGFLFSVMSRISVVNLMHFGETKIFIPFKSKGEVEKPFLTFRENFKKDMKRLDHHMSDLRKQLAGRYAAVEKARKALVDRQKELDLKTQQLDLKVNSSKAEEDMKKARRKSTQAGDELMRCVDLYNQAQSKWFEEMVTTSLELERLEVERVEMFRQHLCQYTTLRHETDMFNQSTMEPVDKLLQCVDPVKDRELWVRENKTGDIRPVNLEI